MKINEIEQGFQEGFTQGYTYKKITFRLVLHIHPAWFRRLFLPLHVLHQEAGDDPPLRLENLIKVYDTGTIKVLELKKINLTIDRGGSMAITGYSGSGKSTFMNALGCLDRPTLGRCYLDDVGVAKMTLDELFDVRNRKIGFVLQSFNLISRTSAFRDVELPMTYAKVSKARRLQGAGTLLERVGLGIRQDYTSNEPSERQRQRVAIAKALANEPPLVLADEPTDNLDTASPIEAMELFSQLYQEGVTVMVITHEEDIAALMDRVIRLSDRQIQSDMLSIHGNDSHGTCACGSGKKTEDVD